MSMIEHLMSIIIIMYMKEKNGEADRTAFVFGPPNVINHLRVSKLEYKHSIGEDK